MDRYVSLLFKFLVIFFSFNIWSIAPSKHYPLTNDPIDVVIVTHPKDSRTLDYCIEGIKKNGKNVRRVIVVSLSKITDKAEWFDEKGFPFSLDEVFLEIGRGDRVAAENYFKHLNRPPGWYLQQLLKLYAPYVIPNISPNVLVVDSDTIFLNPVSFMNEANGGLFCVSYRQPKERYLLHAKRLVPGYVRVYPEFYSVCHHMLFQRPILDDLFAKVEQRHQMPFWKAFCRCVDISIPKKAASEYEIYYNFALRRTPQVEIRELKWTESGELSRMDEFKKSGYHYASFHTYLLHPARRLPFHLTKFRKN